ncbi:unnamed protein product [marine sediment metagenome]|uniref:Methyltransferase FkbM domain-containing protein n=1 Tax=marine sediment metagenome TaxID=412755 RepID=X0ZDL6_9ZZZZ
MKILKKIKRKLWRLIFKNARLSYSQSGEDMILDTIFCNIKTGIYVDVGANDPFIASNTHYFYKKGWHGVNVDALPGSMKYFNKVRPHDINIEAAISNNDTELTYYMFSSSSYNTFLDKKIERLKTITQLIGEKRIKTIMLAEIFDSLKMQDIDFMSVDVEGMDFNVLKSNNWNKYRPKVVITEYFSKDIDLLSKDDMYHFLIDAGYRFLCNSPTNAFYIENDFFNERFGN